MADDDGKRICVARIGAAHGIRGEVRLFSFTADPSAVADYGPLTTADGRTFAIAAMRPAKDCFVARFEGVTDRNAAERLRNTELYVPRDRLPADTDDGEFYHADLIGLAIVDRDGGPLGSVVDVHNFGAGDILEVKLDARRNTVMLPFNATVVPAIDIDAGRVTVELPADTFNDDLPPEEGRRGRATGD